MGKPRCARIVAITIGSRMAVMIVKGPLTNIDSEPPFEQPGPTHRGRRRGRGCLGVVP